VNWIHCFYSEAAETPECDSTGDDSSTGVGSSDDALKALPEGQVQQVLAVRV